MDVLKRFPLRYGPRFRAAHTDPQANRDLWIWYWLAAGGIDPDRDIELLTVPSTDTFQGMGNGVMEAFSTGDPWPYWASDPGVISYPYRSLSLWFLVDRVNREDLWRQAATELGLPADQIPNGSSRGKETFFDSLALKR